MAAGAVGYVVVGIGLLALAPLSEGVSMWLTLAGAICMLWLGGTLAATARWRPTNGPPPSGTADQSTPSNVDG